MTRAPLPALEALAERLAVDPSSLSGLARFTDEQVAGLDRAVAGALAIEDDAVDAGMRHALAMVPRPLRGRARSLLFPRGHDE